jgi:hypothetical protein
MGRAKGRISDRGHDSEKEVADKHLGDFKAEGSRGQLFLKKLAPQGDITRVNLLWLGHVFSELTGVQFPRDFQRRRVLVIKWFNDNIEVFEPLQQITWLDLQPTRSRGRRSEITEE